MKVRVIQGFSDKYTRTYYEEDKILDITKERYKEILEVGKLVEEIKEEPTIDNIEEELEEVKSKKETKKKKK